jgi:hypothetical protein
MESRARRCLQRPDAGGARVWRTDVTAATGLIADEHVAFYIEEDVRGLGDESPSRRRL